MARITEECISRIKDSTDIVDLLGRYLQLRRSGNGWTACCPFHNEKTPSFHVNPARQIFKCFGCGVGGDAVKFLMMFENLDYPTALRRIADMNGIAVVEEEENPEVARQRRLRSRVIEANQLAADYYHRMLCRNHDAGHVRAYLKKRGFNIDAAKSWQLGWAPPSFGELQQLAAAKNIDTRLLTEAYLLGKGRNGQYPVFRDRLMFPIHNVRGEVVGFSGRVMQEEQDPRKYVNTAETVAFRKGEQLFGLHKATGPIAKADMTVIVCEGQLDVIACHEKADIRNTVAGLGTAFTDEHALILRKYAKKAILCYDSDNAGIKASEKTYRKLAQAGLDVYMASLPAGEDPDSLISTQGPEALRQAITEARPYLEARLSRELQMGSGRTENRAGLITRMADLVAEIKDSNRRDVAVVDLATRLNTGMEDLRGTVAEIIKARKNAPPSYDSRESTPAHQGWDEAQADGIVDASDEPIRPVVAVRLHPTMRGLISMAAGSTEVQHLLVDKIEELQEPIRMLSGGEILQRLLELLPAPASPEAWQQFLARISPEQAAALRDINNAALELSDTAAVVEQACARAARDSVSARIDILRARIRGNDVSEQEALKILAETTALQQLLNS